MASWIRCLGFKRYTGLFKGIKITQILPRILVPLEVIFHFLLRVVSAGNLDLLLLHVASLVLNALDEGSLHVRVEGL